MVDLTWEVLMSHIDILFYFTLMLWPLSWNSSPQYESINSNLLVENIMLTIKLASPIYYIQLYYCYFPLFFFFFFKLSVPNLVILYLSIFWKDIYLISSFLFGKIVILYLSFFFFEKIVILYLVLRNPLKIMLIRMKDLTYERKIQKINK